MIFNIKILPSVVIYNAKNVAGAIDAIINQIKGGRFSLKATDKEVKSR